MNNAQMDRAAGMVAIMRSQVERLENLLALAPPSELLVEIGEWVYEHAPVAHMSLSYGISVGVWELAVWPGGQHPKLRDDKYLTVEGRDLAKVCAEMLSYLREVKHG